MRRYAPSAGRPATVLRACESAASTRDRPAAPRNSHPAGRAPVAPVPAPARRPTRRSGLGPRPPRPARRSRPRPAPSPGKSAPGSARCPRRRSFWRCAPIAPAWPVWRVRRLRC
ncbi:hypothetical protein G6F57_020286 [Rhizopus arrhizus]|nr:hypothetical protein G6F24_018001 [Rhizopus arrhizus]KAG0755567.1 hypothetical protein G6F22_020572 [Rhizopus arrhizus]KAG1437345.1 hypothetical protein G6F57_020286 [Rhizopus arrhizus]